MASAELTFDDGITIRHVRTHEEFLACVAMQAETWGASFRETVPATILKVSQFLGGVTAGAFAVDGTLVGFVFGMTGVEDGALVHWSDMLAVKVDLQNHGVGRRLKAFQHDAVRALGVKRMYWTFDPLVARNAHLNLNRLGARVVDYVPDMYGKNTGSALHDEVGTDRFIVAWQIATEAGFSKLYTADGFNAPTPDPTNAAPVLNEGNAVDLHRFGLELPGELLVEIPTDIGQVQAESVAEASRWRASTRRAFQWAFANGYSVDSFQSGVTGGRGFYRLKRG